MSKFNNKIYCAKSCARTSQCLHIGSIEWTTKMYTRAVTRIRVSHTLGTYKQADSSYKFIDYEMNELCNENGVRRAHRDRGPRHTILILILYLCAIIRAQSKEFG